MTPQALRLRQERNKVAALLSFFTAQEARNARFSVPHSSIERLLSMFLQVQTMWSLELADKSGPVSRHVHRELAGACFDWGDHKSVGMQIDNAELRWGSMACSPGLIQKPNDVVAQWVASGATSYDFFRIHAELKNMPAVLGGQRFLVACSLGAALRAEAMGKANVYDHSDVLLLAFHEAQRHMGEVKRHYQEALSKMGVKSKEGMKGTRDEGEKHG